MKWASWVTFVCGIWLIIAPFVLRYGTRAASTEDVILGILIAAFSFAAAYMLGSGLGWLVFLLGIWVLIAPWVIGYAGAAPIARNNDVILGILTIVFGLVRAAARARTRREVHY